VFKVQIGVGFLGVLFLTGVLISKFAQQEPVTEAQILAIASSDDPKPSILAPDMLHKILSSASETVVYLPECSGCTVADPVPDPLPSSMKDTIFVMRTNNEIPSCVGAHRLIIDTDGSIQRSLNAFKLPRAYEFENKHLKSFQRLNESVSSFFSRERT
jgi:hypothetical protein